jgi:hypothetical protein
MQAICYLYNAFALQVDIVIFENFMYFCISNIFYI